MPDDRQTPTDCEALERFLKGLLPGKFSSLSIEFNEPSATNYQTVGEFAEAPDFHIFWVSDAERDKAIAENSMWSIQWYPNNPVSSHYLAASSLTALIEAVRTFEDA